MAKKRILQVAFDPNVLKTREIILTRAGHLVTSIAGAKAALELQPDQLEEFDLVLIGRDAALTERNRIARHFKTLHPDCKIIALHSPAQSNRVEHADLNCPGDDPNEWLSAIKMKLNDAR